MQAWILCFVIHWMAASRFDEKNAIESLVRFVSIDISIKIYKNGEKKGDDGTTESLDISPTGCRTFIGTISCLDPVLIKG